MAHDARAVVERLLQALLGVVIDDRRAQRVQVERDRAVVNLALVTANHIARTFAERRNGHAMRIAQAAVNDDGRGLAVFAGARIGEYFVIERKGLDLAVNHKRQRAAHSRCVLDDCKRIEVVQVFLGRHGAAITRIGQALKAVLVTVID